tara:strand:- start:869 stop:1285 length:417 start_codon:yes stop_codon:yes gene_type:complete
MQTELLQFSKEEVDKIWPMAEKYITDACKSHGGYNASDIKQFLKSGAMQLWVALATENKKVICVCVTEIRKYPNFSVCDLRIAIGQDFNRWVDFMDTICAWAKKNGCRKMEIFARPGWERILKNKKFFKTHVQLEKEL